MSSDSSEEEWDISERTRLVDALKKNRKDISTLQKRVMNIDRLIDLKQKRRVRLNREMERLRILSEGGANVSSSSVSSDDLNESSSVSSIENNSDNISGSNQSDIDEGGDESTDDSNDDRSENSYIHGIEHFQDDALNSPASVNYMRG